MAERPDGGLHAHAGRLLTAGVVLAHGQGLVGGHVRNSTVSAGLGLMSLWGGTVDRSRITGHTAIRADTRTTTVTRSVLESLSNDAINARVQYGINTEVNLDGVAIACPDAPSATAIHASTSAYADYTIAINVVNSVIRGCARPLIDAGDPSSADGLDLDGATLIADGDGDGTARRDVGPLEAPTASPPPRPDTAPPAGPTPPPPAGPAADTRPPVLSGLRATRRRARFSLSEPASVSIVLRDRTRHRIAAKLERPSGAGANVALFKRALKPAATARSPRPSTPPATGRR